MPTIRFAGDLPGGVVLAMALAAAFAVMWFYARETRTMASPYSYLLPALRAAAVALVIFILAGPVWHRRQEIGTLGKVTFAIDTSASMSITDSTGSDASESRIRRATRLLVGTPEHPGLVDQLSETHDIEVIGFGSAAAVPLWSNRDEEPLETALQLIAEDRRTNLASAVSAATVDLDAAGVQNLDAASVQNQDDAIRSKPANNANKPANASEGENDTEPNRMRSAIVIFSEGRHNLGPSPVDAARRIGSSATQVMTLGMGSEDEPVDVGVSQVIRPDSVAADGRLSGKIIVKQFGMTGKPLGMRIEHQNKTVWQHTITPDTEGEIEVPYDFEVESLVQATQQASVRGVSRDAVALDLRVVVDGAAASDAFANDSDAAGNIMAENDSMPFRVAASIRDRRLLILDGSSRWETRYLRNLFERDPAWRVDTVLYGPGTDIPNITRGNQAGQFPSDAEAISQYDAIILGELPPEQFKHADAALLRQFVSRGGGLIVIDGRYQRVQKLVETFLSDLIPVIYSGGDATIDGGKIVPTVTGGEQPMMLLRQSDNTELSNVADRWSRLPTPQYVNQVEPQAGAEVWANTVQAGGKPNPWLVTRLFGAGRVFYVSSDQSWRWRYKLADELHARFWNQVLSAVMQPPYSASDSFVSLGTDRVEYAVGDSSLIRVRLQGPSGKPLGDATVDALLVTEDRVVATVALSVDDPSRGTYQGETQPLEPGEYEVRIRASGFDSTALQATTPIWVGTPDHAELRRVGLDANALMQIAQAGKGSYFHESSADQLLEQLKPLSSGSIIESDVLVWQSFYWFWVVIALLTAEWLLRKRAGLV
ncbi:glutamine amidotransferase [Novipirellula sp.]|uniref:glutamine amidotransferase n=1 Tax=Novipirellula sp. TaxID=2795430 RepID=UPI003566FDDD